MSKGPTFWSRYRKYPLSCLGHTAQGAICGLLATVQPYGAMVAFTWAALFVAYQGLSFARKIDWDGRGDTAGLDTMDFIVGFGPAAIIAMIAINWGAIWEWTLKLPWFPL